MLDAMRTENIPTAQQVFLYMYTRKCEVVLTWDEDEDDYKPMVAMTFGSEDDPDECRTLVFPVQTLDESRRPPYVSVRYHLMNTPPRRDYESH